MPHKLIKDIDEETWNKFVAFCKLKNVKVGDELDSLLKEYLEKNFKKLLEK